jgi:hypothetical protein
MSGYAAQNLSQKVAPKRPQPTRLHCVMPWNVNVYSHSVRTSNASLYFVSNDFDEMLKKMSKTNYF